MDQIREYLFWRHTPKELAISIKRYYEHYYERQARSVARHERPCVALACECRLHLPKSLANFLWQPVFDEKSILRGLSPSLKRQLITSICRDTLGRHPLFRRLSPDFQSILYPFLKPISFSPGDVIFYSGATSMDLLFLLDGQASRISILHHPTPLMSISLRHPNTTHPDT
eukprot:5569315-Prymnesium_polylepis.1